MRIGLLGVGRLGATHAATLRALPEVTEPCIDDADAERGEVENACTAADALEALRIAEAAGASWREKRAVRLSEVA